MTSNPIVEKVLQENKHFLNDDYDKYRNHVYRVFHFCLKIDNKTENADKYAIASIFHDLGIWTNNTFDYLKPSIDEAIKYLDRNRKPEWSDEISVMIDMHHKISRYTGRYEKTVETFRRADWIEVTRGILNFKVDRKQINALQKTFPVLGFHGFFSTTNCKELLKTSVESITDVQKIRAAKEFTQPMTVK